ncbi:surface glycan-binding family protein [Bacteroides clarus]|uniref:surface glycan-binding family protein n=1 Tax=Bacteroides clarus TaxID=626929 RepID=UPI0011DDB762|nr:surface glycan-binding family protein [Bacteroides clarus]
MKHTLHTLTSRFLGILWLVASVCMFVSCSDDTDETGGNFKLYYPDMTDIGPSMTGVKIPAPSFQGGTPSEFEITAVTLNDESIENPCFVIDTETGEITINSTAETPVGEYKLTISCSVNGKYFTFKDIIKVTFLPRAPEGTVAEPNHILVMYSVVSDPNNITKLPTAQVKTAGEHVSITKYSIGTVTVNGEVLDKPEEMFEVSSSGEISILKSERFKRGVTYSISLKLETAATGDTPCIATDILAVEVASEPFSLEYPGYNAEEGWKMPNTSSDEGGSSFISEVPVFVGSTDGIKYWIEIDNEKGKDKILIDETTGIISVPQGHGFDIGDKFKISVFVANIYLPEGKRLTDVNLSITKFYKPLDDFTFYNDIEIEQTNEISLNPNDWSAAGYEDLTFSLLDTWGEILTLDPETFIITAPKDNTIAVGEYTVPFRVTNGDGTTKNYSFKLTVTENKQKLVWIKCGNNFGTGYEDDIYQNQFRFNKALDNDQSFTINTNLNGNSASITWSLSALKPSDKGIVCTIDNNKLKFSNTTNPDVTLTNSVHVIILTGTTTINGTQSSLSVPIFIHVNLEKNGYFVEFTPFAFRVNPQFGGTSVKPIFKKGNGDIITSSNVALEYRRSFNYYIWDGKNSITDDPQESGILKTLWGSSNPKSAKGPMAYFKTGITPLPDESLKQQIGYVDNSAGAGYSVKIFGEKWKTTTGEYLHGFVRGQMIFEETPDEKFNDSKTQVFPLMIWFDPDYYPVTE